MAMTLAADVMQQLAAAGLPVVSVAIGRVDDRASWRVTLDPEATPAQVASAAALVDAYDLVAGAARMADADTLSDIDQKVLRAIVAGLWDAIPAPLLTKAQLRARIIAIYKAL